MKIYAGLDTDGIAKLFVVGDDNQPKLVNHQTWLDITKPFNLEPGECVRIPFDYLSWLDKRLVRIESILTQMILSG